MPTAKSIDEVLLGLDLILAEAANRRSRLALFAALRQSTPAEHPTTRLILPPDLRDPRHPLAGPPTTPPAG